MLLIWFGIVLALALILIVLGYSFSQPPLAISGASLLFLLGSVVMFSSLEVRSGYSETLVAPCNNNCTEVRQNETTFLAEVSTTSIVYTYASIPEEEVVGVGINHLLGFFLVLIGVFCFIDVVISLRGLK